MKHALTFPLRLLAFWLLFFAAFRLWFVLWFHAEWSPPGPGRVWLSFWHGLPLDLSMAGYLLVLPVLFWFAGLAIHPRSMVQHPTSNVQRPTSNVQRPASSTSFPASTSS